MTLAAGGMNLDMFKGMEFDEVEDITETLADEQGFDSSATFKRANAKEPSPLPEQNHSQNNINPPANVTAMPNATEPKPSPVEPVQIAPQKTKQQIEEEEMLL